MDLSTANAQYHQVTLSGVVPETGAVANIVGPVFGVLLGDVNASSRVDSGDLLLTRQQNLQPVEEANFRADVNTSGRIDSGDVVVTRQQNLSELPSEQPRAARQH